MIIYQYEKFMNTLLFFALPVATIILAIVLQKILKCPILVAATFFAIYLIVTFAVFDSSFLIFAIVYTILAYITAALTRLICDIISRCNLWENSNCICNNANNGNTIANGTWSCCRRNNNIARIGITASGGTINTNENTSTTNNENEIQNDSVVVVQDENNLRRNNCNCSRR